ncbi:MAG: DNA repair protein RecO [Candidatus Magasanikbacteria bacterium]|nr:DNA repair protein RecO [Candidatus Magasanikbacteria bacterium]
MQAIVLKRAGFRESDQIVTLLTLEKGKVTALARGVKKIASKNSAYLEPFFLIEAELIPGKNINHITKVVGLNSFKNIRSDLQKCILAQKAVSMVDKLIEENERDAPVFSLLLNWLETVNEKDYGRGYFFGFVAKLFKILGFSPVLDKCIACGKIVPKEQKNSFYVFSPKDGGLKCAVCRQKNDEASAVKFSMPDREVWLMFLSNIPDQWPGKISRAMESSIWSFAEYHIGKKLAKISEI